MILEHSRASGYCGQGERRHSGRDPKRLTGSNRESRRREDAGRRNYPEAVPEKMRGGNGRWIESSNWRSGETGVACRGVRDLLTRGRGGQRMSPCQTRSAPGSRLLGGEPTTRRPVGESVGERGTLGESEAGRARQGREDSDRDEP